jgi:hypothetical protein
MQEDYLFAVRIEKPHRVHPASHQPIQIRAQFDIRDPLKRAPKIVQVVDYFVSMIVQVQDNLSVGRHLDQLAQQVGLIIQLLDGLRLGGGPAASAAAHEEVERDAQ